MQSYFNQSCRQASYLFTELLELFIFYNNFSLSREIPDLMKCYSCCPWKTWTKFQPGIDLTFFAPPINEAPRLLKAGPHGDIAFLIGAASQPQNSVVARHWQGRYCYCRTKLPRTSAVLRCCDSIQADIGPDIASTSILIEILKKKSSAHTPSNRLTNDIQVFDC
jgi:hypothetical protein